MGSCTFFKYILICTSRFTDGMRGSWRSQSADTSWLQLSDRVVRCVSQEQNFVHFFTTGQTGTFDRQEQRPSRRWSACPWHVKKFPRLDFGAQQRFSRAAGRAALSWGTAGTQAVPHRRTAASAAAAVAAAAAAASAFHYHTGPPAIRLHCNMLVLLQYLRHSVVTPLLLQVKLPRG
jgi:hypothetical protein